MIQKNCPAEKKLRERAGFTLIEVIVSFTLLALLLVMAITVLISFSNVYVKITTLVKARSIASIVTEDIENELSTASREVKLQDSDGSVVDLSDGNATGSSISYRDSNGNEVTILLETEDTDRLNQYKKKYHAIIQEDTGMELRPESYWYYPSKTYMGMEITKLTFEYKAPKYILVTLEVSAAGDDNSTKFETSHYIECFNLSATDFLRGEGADGE